MTLRPLEHRLLSQRAGLSFQWPEPGPWPRLLSLVISQSAKYMPAHCTSVPTTCEHCLPEEDAATPESGRTESEHLFDEMYDNHAV